MRDIKYIVVHCTGTRPEASIESIRNYWKEVRRWENTPGYHYIVDRFGEITQLQLESKIANGVKGHNHESVHIAWIGGVDKEGKIVHNMSKKQEEKLFYKIVSLSEKYREAEIVGHTDFEGVTKACPVIDVKTWLKNYVPPLEDRT